VGEQALAGGDSQAAFEFSQRASFRLQG
jgi:hypothetical protein